MTDPYSGINKKNFEGIKEILEWGINKSKTPIEIAQAIADHTDMPIAMARALVQEELINSMEWMKDGNKTSN
jgi:hypothetical protein